MQRRQMIARIYSASVFVDWQPAGIYPVNTFNLIHVVCFIRHNSNRVAKYAISLVEFRN